jgi:hypothetical protein
MRPGRPGSGYQPSFEPKCPHTAYGADGTIAPIFCTIDDPVALNYYARALKPLLVLGPRPTQVKSVLAWEFHHGGPNGEALTGTYPIQCQVFQLAAHYWRWHFSYAPPHCPLPPNT